MKKSATIVLLFFSIMASAQFGMMPNTGGVIWNANWIGVPGMGESEPGVYLFRKTLNLESVTSDFEIYVTADNRYKLYVNGQLVSLGPAWGDIENWNYETVDLAPYLKRGENIISAIVWNMGSQRPIPQISLRTGFMLQGASEETQVLNTNDTWKCIQDKSYTFIRQTVSGYYAAGPGERIDMHSHIQGWKSLGFNDSNWIQAAPLFSSTQGRFGGGGGGTRWTLQPSIIPQMERTMLRLRETRRTEGVSVPRDFPAQKAPVTIPANTTATILLDQTYYVNAYPTLIFSGGGNSVITITYAEALYGEERAKDNRNEIEGKTMFGRQDTLISNGSNGQEYTSLDWRTYRYVELKIETKNTPLVIDDFYGTFTGYPFELTAKIEAGNKSTNEEINKIMEVGWRTARSCAVETYMDCPYYERLQYIGDARIQMLVSYYNTGDDRLAKNALNLIDQSRKREGVTNSRYPDYQGQIIAPYSLWYITMLQDYLMYGTDKEFLSDKVLGWRQIINYFSSYMEDGSLKNVPGWNFTDWATEWRGGGGGTLTTGPVGEDGSSAVMDLQLLIGLQAAQALEESFGDKYYAELYGNIAKELSATIREKYWDASRGLFADTPEKDKFSQHSNSMAILAGLVTGEQAKRIAEIMLADKTLAQATIYFRFYLHLALNEAGLGDGYLSWLDDWRRNIELGMTTYGETSDIEKTRSDCHAWGASPNIEFFRIMLGIDSDAPYFEKVKIEPNLGSIKKISGEMPHPAGTISVVYDNSGRNLKADITLPQNTPGTFIWKGKSYDLKGGSNTINVQ